MIRRWSAVIAIALLPNVASASCVNRFMERHETSGRWVVTLLTGYLTFQEAQTLAHDIEQKKVQPIEWVDEKGKTLARQLGDLKVVRPMPVACGGKPSGVIVVATFLAARPPSDKMRVKFDSATIVDFDEQKE